MKKEKKDSDFIKKAYFPGGVDGMRQFIAKHLVYPEEARKQGVEGSVALRIEIDQTGVVKRTRIIKSLGFGCDEEAEGVPKLMLFEVPSQRFTKLVFHKTIHIHFIISKQPKQTPVAPSTAPTAPSPLSHPTVQGTGTKPTRIVYTVKKRPAPAGKKTETQKTGYKLVITPTKKEPPK